MVGASRVGWAAAQVVQAVVAMPVVVQVARREVAVALAGTRIGCSVCTRHYCRRYRR